MSAVAVAAADAIDAAADDVALLFMDLRRVMTDEELPIPPEPEPPEHCCSSSPPPRIEDLDCC